MSTILVVLLAMGGCATRPVNPPVAQVDPTTGYRLQTRQAQMANRDTLVFLAFSGGGTRAAEFKYLNNLPTSFALPPEAIDRLRAAAGMIIAASPEFKRLSRDVGANIIPPSSSLEPNWR